MRPVTAQFLRLRWKVIKEVVQVGGQGLEGDRPVLYPGMQHVAHQQIAVFCERRPVSECLCEVIFAQFDRTRRVQPDSTLEMSLATSIAFQCANVRWQILAGECLIHYLQHPVGLTLRIARHRPRKVAVSADNLLREIHGAPSHRQTAVIVPVFRRREALVKTSYPLYPVAPQEPQVGREQVADDDDFRLDRASLEAMLELNPSLAIGAQVPAGNQVDIQIPFEERNLMF